MHRTAADLRGEGELRATLIARSLLPELQLVIDDTADLVSWKTKPQFWSGGRTAWHVLERAVPVSEPLVPQVAALKLKGLGLKPPAPGEAPRPPNSEVYRRRPNYRDHLHLGFEDGGKLALVPSTPSPLGGLRVSAAMTEYTIARRLLDQGVSTVLPIAAYQFDELLFRGDDGDEEPMGVVVTGVADGSCHRAAAVLNVEDWSTETEETAYVRELAEHMGVTPSPHRWGRQRIEITAELSARYGRALRAFSEAGCYRYSGHTDNYLYNQVTGGVTLVDLDSSRLLEHCSDGEAPLQIARDVMSGMFNLACQLLAPLTIHRSSADDIGGADPFGRFLAGYYHDVSLPPGLTHGFLHYFSRVHQRVARRRGLINSDQEHGRDLFHQLWMRHVFAYSLLLRIAIGPYHRSGLMDQFPQRYDRRAMDQHIAAFAGAPAMAEIRSLCVET